MSLTKLLKAPIKMFKKEVITFLIIRRYDLGILSEYLRYIAVKPSASISILRQKVWHLLELPDYCEEVIILKSPGDIELPLTELRRGNDPQHPYVLEVWLPGKRDSTTTVLKNMITMGTGDDRTESNITRTFDEIKEGNEKSCNCSSQSTISNGTIAQHKRAPPNNLIYSDFKKSELSCKISSSSIFRVNGRKSKENFTNLLLKIQSDLSTLNNKLTVLENKISA